MVRVFGWALLGGVAAQQAGEVKKEYHPAMPLSVCSSSGCESESTTVTLDANWRWVHNVDGYTNCYNGTWDPQYCPDSDSCCKNCALDGVPQEDWSDVYGVNATSGGFKLGLKQGGNVGSRFYLLEAGKQQYRMFKLKNKEFSFDVDVSTIGCGINGALYFVEMPADGGEKTSRLDLNKAGAKYGTGYCDAQCANDIKFIGGVANINTTSPYGSCCAEMDIWEANSEATQITPHPCSFEGQLRCEGDDCQKVCDMSGCDFNPYRNGAKNFFGKGSNFAVDSSKPMTVVTQFVTSDGTDSGDLKEIRRFYVQDGKTIDNSKTTIDGLSDFNSISDASCTAQKKVFDEDNTFQSHGGMKAVSAALDRGMVLVMSIWDDGAANMLWLDSVYPRGATGPGSRRGPCATDSGDPTEVEKEFANSYVTFTNIKFGDIGSTGGPSPSPVPPVPSTTVAPTGGCCSWDGKYCGDTTDYCKGNADQCADCKGQWCTDCLPPYKTTTPGVVAI